MDAIVVDSAPIILDQIVWKLRMGLGKYTSSTSWERRRVTLSTSKRLIYYAKESKTTLDGKTSPPRGLLDILPECTTIAMTYPGDANNQPTRFCITIRDYNALTDVTKKWKICFDNRETQLLWLVALTDMVSNVSSNDRLFGLVQNALFTSGRKADDNDDGEEIEAVQSCSTNEIHVVVGDNQIITATSTDSFDSSSSDYDDDMMQQSSCIIPLNDKMYHVLAIIGASLLIETVTNLSSTILWKTVIVIIVCICFYTPGGRHEMKSLVAAAKEKPSIEETDSRRLRRSTLASTTKNTSDLSLVTTMSESISVTELPVTPSIRFDNIDDNSLFMKADVHERWAVSAANVDLSGEWSLIVNEAFVQEYDVYLKQLGIGKFIRKVACSVIGRTTETVKQSDNGRKLHLKLSNPKGVWERQMLASGYPDFNTDDSKQRDSYMHTKIKIKTADGEDVDAEAWWEENGKKHRSFLRGGTKYGGGDFESVRYIMEGSTNNELICESTFHPTDLSKEKAIVTWRFRRG